MVAQRQYIADRIGRTVSQLTNERDEARKVVAEVLRCGCSHCQWIIDQAEQPAIEGLHHQHCKETMKA